MSTGFFKDDGVFLPMLNDCWFGNVAKPIRQQFKTQDNIEIWYNSSIRNWRLKY